MASWTRDEDWLQLLGRVGSKIKDGGVGPRSRMDLWMPDETWQRPRYLDEGNDVIHHLISHYGCLDGHVILRLEAMDLSPIYGDLPPRRLPDGRMPWTRFLHDFEDFEEMAKKWEEVQMVGRPFINY